MSGNFRTSNLWRERPGIDLRAVLFVSRNKDNRHLDGFKERRKAFVAYFYHYDVPKWLEKEFNFFVSQGQYSEFSRMYVSVNPRSERKIRKNLFVNFLNDPEYLDLSNIEAITAREAAKRRNRGEFETWLFDFDFDRHNSDALITEFCDDIEKAGGGYPKVYPTPNGYAVLTEPHFDNRELAKKWGEVGIPKKDDLLCVRWQYNYAGMNRQVAECAGAEKY